MADAVTSQTLVSGSRNLVMKFTNISDGTGEAAVKKVDVTDSQLRIMKIHYATLGMSVDILWDATTDVLAWNLPEGQVGCFDFTDFGGIQNNAGTGVTGDIMFTTIGHASGDRYSIILEMRTG